MNEQEIFNLLQKELERFKYNKSNLTKSNTGDGRGESSESERKFCEALKEFLNNNTLFTAEIPAPRHWYDIAIYYENFFLPVNVKLTDAKTADNISSKLGLFYTLTGINPENNSKGLTRWYSYNQKLVEDYNYDTEADYYLLVYNKITEDIFLSSLKRVNKLVSNGSNLPFQCNWGCAENHAPTIRNKKEQCKYLMLTFIESWEKRIQMESYNLLLEWRESYNEQ